MITCQYEPEAGYMPVVVMAKLQDQNFPSSVIHLFFFGKQFLDPVYGHKDTPFTEFMAPGLIIS